jgi:hypothetical protein
MLIGVYLIFGIGFLYHPDGDPPSPFMPPPAATDTP